MNSLNVFGGNGFVGSQFCKTTNNKVILNERNDYTVKSANCLYCVSTIHNYNVYDDNLLDINTNLIVLMKVLDNYKKYIDETKQEGCFNFISSWFVYGKDCGFDVNSTGISENEFCDPKGFYSITKRCAEQLLISYCSTFNLNYRILRLANILGKNDNKVSQKKNALQFMFNQFKTDNPVELYDNGQIYRDYIDVRDCANAIELILNKGELNSIYNIGNGIPLVFRDLIEYAHKKLNSKSEIKIIEQKEFHKKVQSSRSFYMNNDKLKSLGYSPKYTIWETIDEILECTPP